MMNILNKKYLYGAAVLLLAISCSTKDAPNDNAEEQCGRYVDYMHVSYGTRADGDTENQEDQYLASDIFNDTFEGTLERLGAVTLYFSQLSPAKIPFEPVPDSVANKNLYHYNYGRRDIYPNPNWDEGYDFFPAAKEDMLDWDFVKQEGPIGNGFQFFALYYPYDNQMHDFKVSENQSDLDSLLWSNVLGAYHSTSSIYTRLRFNLFHLMVYMKVTLYVPVFKYQDSNTGDSQAPSGFPADALQKAVLNQVYHTYNINWYADRSSDSEAPLTQADQTKYPIDIQMYMHPFPDGSSTPPIKTISVKEYYPDAPESEVEDEVYEYTFSVLFPAGQISNFTDFNFLSFYLKSNTGPLIKKYNFTGSQYAGTGQFRLSQGNLQELVLYLPRKGAEAILVTADIIDWTPSWSDMHVSQEPYEEPPKTEETPGNQ